MNGSTDSKTLAYSPTKNPLFPKVEAPLYGGCCGKGMRFGMFDNGENPSNLITTSSVAKLNQSNSVAEPEPESVAPILRK